MPIPPDPSAPVGRPALWLGTTGGVELGLASSWLATITAVVTGPGPGGWRAHGAGAVRPEGDSAGARPWLALLSCPRPGTWSVAEVSAVAAALPLVPIVAVTTSLAEGSRRTGDALPGVDELPWLELPGRLWGWRGGDGSSRITLPATARRDERWLSSSARRPPAPAHSSLSSSPTPGPSHVAVATPRAAREALCDLLEAAGFRANPLPEPFPRPGCPGPLLWDVGGTGPESLAWLRLLTADGRRDVVVLESFPRGDGVRAALDAGAAAVLPRVVDAETLAGTIDWIARRTRQPSATPFGIGAAVPGR